MRRLPPLLAAIALLSACRSDSERLVDLRTDLRTTLDALYSAYGGSGLAAEAEAEAKADAEKTEAAEEGRGIAARLVGEMDRSYFEGYCLARGRGERPFALSGRLAAFMKDASNERACRDAAKLAARIAELEAKTEQ